MNIVIQSKVDIPNRKDRDQWLAGGDLRNATMAGGDLWSPTSIGSFDNYMKTDNNSNLMNGNILAFLGYGFGGIMNAIRGYNELDLMFDDSTKTTRVYKISIIATTSNGDIVYKSEGKEQSFEFNSYNMDSSISEMSLREKVGMWNNQRNMFDLISANPINIGLEVVDMLTNDTATVKDVINGAVFGTVYSTMKSMALNAIGQLAGMTTMTIGNMLGLGLLSSIIDEFVGVALGVDNYFGFGGDLVSYNNDGTGLYSPPSNIGNYISDLVTEIATLGQANTVTFNPKSASYYLTDILGNLVKNPDYVDPNFNEDAYRVNPSLEVEGYSAGGYTVTRNKYNGWDVTNDALGVTTSTDAIGNYMNENGTIVGSVNDQTEQMTFENTSPEIEVSPVDFAVADVSLTQQEEERLAAMNTEFDSSRTSASYNEIKSWDLDGNGFNDNYERAVANITGYNPDRTKSYNEYTGEWTDVDSGNGDDDSGWGDGGSNNSDGMGNNSNSSYGDESGYGDGNGGFGGI